MMIRAICCAVRVIFVVALCAAPAIARGQTTVFDTAALMPRSAEMVVVVHRGEELRRSDIGRAFTEAIDRLYGFGQTGRAWDEVARALGMNPGDAFDAVLGERMAFASHVDDGGVEHWVMVSQLRPGVREKLVRSFQAAPRQVAEGAIVLGVEDGAFSMILLDRPGETFLVIGPGEGDAMLLEVARSLRNAGVAALAGSSELAELRQLGGKHANLLVLLRETVGEGSWTGAIGTARGATLDSNFRVEMPALAGMEDRGAVWSREAFRRLSRGALAAAVDIAGPLEVEGPAAKLILPLELPQDMKSVMGSRVAMVARPGREGPIELAVALETTDSIAMGQAGDLWMDKILLALPKGSGGQQMRAEQFASMPPTASRAVDLSRQLPTVRQNGWTNGPMLTWNSRIVAQNCNPGQVQGWWTAGIGSGSVGMLSSLVSNPPPDAIPLPVVAIGMVRPSAILEVLGKSGWVMPPVVVPLKAIERVEWEAMRSGSTELMGNFRVVLKTPATQGAVEGAGQTAK